MERDIMPFHATVSLSKRKISGCMMYSLSGAPFPTAGTQTSTPTGLLRKHQCDTYKKSNRTTRLIMTLNDDDEERIIYLLMSDLISEAFNCQYFHHPRRKSYSLHPCGEKKDWLDVQIVQ